jgi:hypothetical protein
MKQDPANDGPEVKLIAFFSMFPEGSFSRRVSSVTDRELGLRFILSLSIDEIRRRNEKPGRVHSKRIIPAAA